MVKGMRCNDCEKSLRIKEGYEWLGRYPFNENVRLCEECLTKRLKEVKK